MPGGRQGPNLFQLYHINEQITIMNDVTEQFKACAQISIRQAKDKHYSLHSTLYLRVLKEFQLIVRKKRLSSCWCIHLEASTLMASFHSAEKFSTTWGLGQAAILPSCEHCKLQQ